MRIPCLLSQARHALHFFYSPVRANYSSRPCDLHMSLSGTFSREAGNVLGRFMRERARRPALHRAGPHVRSYRGLAGRWTLQLSTFGDRELVIFFSTTSPSCSMICMRDPARSMVPFECRRHWIIRDCFLLIPAYTFQYHSSKLQQYQYNIIFGMCVV